MYRSQKWLFFVLFFSSFFLQAQEENVIPTVIDSLYREDQVYFSFTYNIVSGTPSEIRTSQFSGGFHTGFIRDFPINSRRNVALGLGLGWSIDTYGHNLYVGEAVEGEGTYFAVLDRDRVDFNTNRFTTQSIDLPIQFRWRTSTPESYKFWRIYAGLRPGYVYYFQSKFVQDGNTYRESDVPEFEKLRLGATFTFGYNTFNFSLYYSLNSFFKDATVNNEDLDLRTFQLGLTFYLL
ncbi:porin family protein [Salinimicrobium sp. TH3]|uniref:porin family protein n=1 Tax=Salinimicrobium sp. TH3 TaxID=2997342 RepID=UPI0022739632|nr:porin family protein [Salinimicrobium sp. TH3]MCY2685696.1 porin family protein [Salinimicrobium sp. TH3]